MSKEINLEGYRLAHTMIRVKDLEASFNFYCKTLGMKVLRKTDYPDGKFTNAFIGKIKRKSKYFYNAQRCYK